MSTSFVGQWLRGCVFASIAFAAACSSSPKGSGGTAGGGAGVVGGTDGGAGTFGVISETVGTSGGTITLDAVTLSVPGDALSADTVVTVTTTTAPAGYLIASAAYQLAPADTTFAQPVSVTIPLTMTAPHAHLFLSNGNGGFEDRGGIVSGPIITAQITHFGTCFAATPSGDGGAADVAGDVAEAKDGAAGSGTAGSGAAGAGGAAGSGTAGAGTAGTAGSGTSADAGQDADAGTDSGNDGGAADASSQLCATMGVNAPVVTVTTITDGTPVPDGSTYTGGTISSGTYYLTAVTHYGGQYGGPQRSVRVFDATAQTLRTVESPFLQGTIVYDAFGISNADDHTLSGALICSSTEAASTSWYYTVSGTTITMNQVGSDDVAVYSSTF